MNLTTVYKLTDKDGNTYNNCRWEIGTERRLPYLSHYRIWSSDVFHAYRDANLGLLMNCPHDEIHDPIRLFEAQGEIVIDDGTRVGCVYIKIVKELPIPSWYSSPETISEVHEQLAKNLISKIIEVSLSTSPGDPILRKLKRENPDDYRSQEFYDTFMKAWFEGYNLPLLNCTAAVHNAIYCRPGECPAILSTALKYAGFNLILRNHLIDLINRSIEQVTKKEPGR